MINFTLNNIFINAQLNEDKVAIIFDEKEYSYKRIFEDVGNVSFNLLKKGVKKRDIIIINLGNCYETVVFFWSILNIGAIPSIVQYDCSCENFDSILRNSQTNFIIINHKFYNKFQCSHIFKTHNIKHIYTDLELQDNRSSNVQSLLMKKSSSFESPLVCSSIIGEDPASIIYTSGSTGSPKGIVMTHNNMINSIYSLHSYLRYKKDDIIIVPLPISFDYGLYQMLLSFYVKGTLVIQKENSLASMTLKNIEKYNCTILPGISSLYSMLYQFFKRGSFDLKSVRLISNTGMPFERKHLNISKEMFPDASIFSMYGLSECKRCTYIPPNRLEEKIDSVGIAIPNLEIGIFDEKDQPCESGKIGEIVIRSSTVMQGYLNNLDATSKRLKSHPLYGDKSLYSGDYGWIDSEGFLYLAGRQDEIFKIRGKKIILREIEKVILSFDEVMECVVIVCNKTMINELVIVAYLVVEDKNISVDYIRKAMSQKLERHKLPESIIFLRNIPKTANGKLDRNKLQRLYENAQ